MSERLPLHDLHAAAGARFGAPCGWELPLDYGDQVAEYRAVREGVGLLDRGHYGVLEVTGRDRVTFLHALLSNDIKGLAPGQGCAATLLDIHGRVQVMLLVWALDDRVLVITPPGLAASTFEKLDQFLFSEKAYFKDATAESALFVVAGPEAMVLIERLAGIVPPPAPWSHVAARLDGIDVRLVRGAGAGAGASGSGETGAPEVWVAGGVADGRAIWARLVRAGARPVGLRAYDTLRIEAGTPLLGHDVDDTVLLPEIPFQQLLSYTKGCYPGQEVVVRIRDRGHVNRMLRGLVMAGDEVPPPGAGVMAGDAGVGRVTSATRSPAVGRPIALAFVRRQQAEAGTAVSVRVGDRLVGATVADLPFVSGKRR